MSPTQPADLAALEDLTESFALVEDMAGRARLTARTKSSELTPEQDARCGNYIRAKEAAARENRAVVAGYARAREALAACGGDKGRALAMLLAGGR